MPRGASSPRTDTSSGGFGISTRFADASCVEMFLIGKSIGFIQYIRRISVSVDSMCIHVASCMKYKSRPGLGHVVFCIDSMYDYMSFYG